MKHSRTNLLSLALVALAFLLSAALYARLPASIPIHWNTAGQVNGNAPKAWGAFLLPAIMAGLYVFLRIAPRISPRGFGMARFADILEIILAVSLAFFFLMHVLSLAVALGHHLPMQRAVLAGTGLFFVVLGNFMGKLRKNFFVGIRTPWTLASDEVWLRTHRLGAKTFVIGGAGLFAGGLAGGGEPVLLAAVAVAAVIPAVASFLFYRRVEGLKGHSGA